MTPQQIERVRASFALVAPIADQAAALFYANLFEADPSLRSLFRGDMAAQGAKLMQMIGAAVRLLDTPHALVPVLRRLGERHAGYRVREAHYATVGTALLRTLEQGLGDAFDTDTRDAWAALYDFVSATMIDAARAPAPHAAIAAEPVAA
jgi:hemoglobin-like flavoprotein